jgi:UrcA family protein
MHKPAIILAAAALLASAAPALAGDHRAQVGPNSYNVHFSDLDLKSAAGRAQALKRIELAAAESCKSAGVRSARKACVARTVEVAAAQRGASAIRTALAERAAAPVRLARSW